MRKSAAARRPLAAFTLVEVLMAATILTVGFMGLIQAVTICSGMMDQARRQTLATQILTHEIEKLRLLPWKDPVGTNGLSNLPDGLATIAIDSAFDDARASVGDHQTLGTPVAFSLSRSVVTQATDLREITFTLTWTVTSNRSDSGGNAVKFTYTRINSAYFGKYGLNVAYQRS